MDGAIVGTIFAPLPGPVNSIDANNAPIAAPGVALYAGQPDTGRDILSMTPPAPTVKFKVTLVALRSVEVKPSFTLNFKTEGVSPPVV